MNEEDKIKDIPINLIGEILQDSFYFSLILHIKCYINDTEIKRYFVMFLKGLASIFAYELALFLKEYKLLEINDYFRPGMKKKVFEERQWIHQCVVNSNKMSLKLNEMGINFDELVYDMNVVLNNEELFDMNFEEYNENDNLEFWNGVFSILQDVSNCIINTITSMTIEEQFKLFDDNAKDFYDNIQKSTLLKRYSYSAYKLFSLSPNLTNIDKIFILYRYRLITSIKYIEEIFKKYNYDMNFEKLFFIKFENYIRKIKALFIDIIGNDLMKMETSYSADLLKSINDNINEKNFFVLNRKLRNNVHYVQTTILSNDELKIVNKNQDIYINLLIDSFSRHIFIDIDSECIQMTNFTKECERKGLSKKDVDLNYEKLYLRFYYTGTLDEI